jgi:hypothetical protein
MTGGLLVLVFCANEGVAQHTYSVAEKSKIIWLWMFGDDGCRMEMDVAWNRRVYIELNPPKLLPSRLPANSVTKSKKYFLSESN